MYKDVHYGVLLCIIQVRNNPNNQKLRKWSDHLAISTLIQALKKTFLIKMFMILKRMYCRLYILHQAEFQRHKYKKIKL